jgi:hypothetical protein
MEGIMKLSLEEDALVQGLFDGSLGPAEQAAAERLVASNPDARRRSSELTELTRLLEALGPAEPPVGFSSRVMDSLNVGETLTHTTNGGLGMGKKLMWGLVAMAAVALIVMKLTGYPPLDGAEGTIGAAKRYQAPAPQITGDDVKLGDASVPTFMQSDVFDRLIKDDATRRMLSDPGFRSALASPGLLHALSSPELRASLSNPALLKSLSDPALLKSLSDPALVKSLSDPALVKALQDPSLASALRDPAFVSALSNPGMSKALSDPGFAQALSNPAFGKALSDPAFGKALSDPSFAKALSDPAFAQGLKQGLRQ